MARKTTITANINICTGKKVPILSAKAASDFIERGKNVSSRVSKRLANRHEIKR